jgi:predicted nucleotidyltransferase
VIRDDVVRVLLGMGIAPNVLGGFPELPTEIEGLLVYGSQARGDGVPGSDLDLLGLVNTPRPSTHSGDVNISYYTHDQLVTGVGTLFGAHLKRDAKIVWDNHGHLSRAVENMGEVDTNRLLERAHRMSELFTSPGRDLPKYLPGLLDGVPAEPGDGAQPAGDGGAGAAAGFQVAGEALDAGAAGAEQGQVAGLAPAGVLAQAQLIGLAGQAAVPGQEPG